MFWIGSFADDNPGNLAHFEIHRSFYFGAKTRLQQGNLQGRCIGFQKHEIEEAQGENFFLIQEGSREPGKGDFSFFL